MLIKVCTMTCKKCAIPSLHRDSFVAKVPGPCPDAASGNTTSPYCRAVSKHSAAAQHIRHSRPAFNYHIVTRQFSDIIKSRDSAQSHALILPLHKIGGPFVLLLIK
jgi:hypothetical protein